MPRVQSGRSSILHPRVLGVDDAGSNYRYRNREYTFEDSPKLLGWRIDRLDYQWFDIEYSDH